MVHSWRAVMAAYIMVMVFLAVLLGYLGDPCSIASSLLSQGKPLEVLHAGGKAAGDESCPWQLDVVTLKIQGSNAGKELSSILTKPKGS